MTINHPTWCSRARCTVAPDGASGQHRSIPLSPRQPDDRTSVLVTAALVQSVWPLDAQIWVELHINRLADLSEITNTGVGHMLPEHARMVGRVLTKLGREAQE